MPASPTGQAAATESFPHASARTQKFTRGAPRSLRLSADGDRLLFIRSSSGDDPVGSLWSVDTVTGAETLVADPRQLLGAGEEELSDEERARRERSRESGAGIVGFATDDAATVAAFALSSRLWVADLTASPPVVREITSAGPVVDPRPDPAGRLVAYAASGGLHVVGVDGDGHRTVAVPDAPTVHWGVAEFVAAEEMNRFRGYWWSPDGATLLTARVDDAPVQRWHVADPAHPERPSTELA
ncbi:MAG TPA: DPP IV N-terminal domain-containing protein, partial [Actinomycetes bacterium]|nr:DPP IV N-terminal domain-containing protein [Actinomycetes bacterium]